MSLLKKREYVHSILHQYTETNGKRKYVSVHKAKKSSKAINVNTDPNDRRNMFVSKFQFTLNPLLEPSFYQTLCVEDYIKIIKVANCRSLWRLALLQGVELTATAINPSASGNDKVELSGRTVIIKKLIETHLGNQGRQRSTQHQTRLPKCIVINDDRIPSLPVYSIPSSLAIDPQTTTTTGPPLRSMIPEYFRLPATNDINLLRTRVVDPCFVFRWNNTFDVIPYLWHTKTISDIPKNVRNQGTFDPKKKYKPNDMVINGHRYYIYNPALTKPAAAAVHHDPKAKLPEGWELCAQKKVDLLEVVRVIPREQYYRYFGYPRRPLDEPIMFEINNQLYFDTPEAFYMLFESETCLDSIHTYDIVRQTFPLSISTIVISLLGDIFLKGDTL